jgi:hypothetical protein
MFNKTTLFVLIKCLFPVRTQQEVITFQQAFVNIAGLGVILKNSSNPFGIGLTDRDVEYFVLQNKISRKEQFVKCNNFNSFDYLMQFH